MNMENGIINWYKNQANEKSYFIYFILSGLFRVCPVYTKRETP